MKFKVQIKVAEDPAVCQEDIGSRTQLCRMYPGKVGSAIRIMQQHKEITFVTITYGSVNYNISKL